MKNRKIELASRPEGEPKPSDFRLAESEAPAPKDGELLLRTLWLSLDPYMRGRMSAAKSYVKPVEIGETMVGGTVSEVVESKHKDFKKGDIVSSLAGWQDYAHLRRRHADEARSQDRADFDRARRARHAGHDRLFRAVSKSASPRKARPWSYRPPPARWARGGADRQAQGLPRRGRRRRRGEVPLRDERARLR